MTNTINRNYLESYINEAFVDNIEILEYRLYIRINTHTTYIGYFTIIVQYFTT